MKFNLEPWRWQPDKCPCDEWFIEWLIGHKKADLHGPVFHMGTGLHHRVGRTCSSLGIECFGLTVSEDEAFAKPDLFGYEVILEDLYKLDPNRLPPIQYMTLFHLGEMVDRFGEIDFAQVEAVMSQVERGGKVFFYTKSSAWDRAKLIRENENLVLSHTYKGLEVYDRKWQG